MRPRLRDRGRTALPVVFTVVLTVSLMGGCTDDVGSPSPNPAPASTPSGPTTSGPTPSGPIPSGLSPTGTRPPGNPPGRTPAATPVPEPTTTNTLPPPPQPSLPAPSTAGRLSERSLPVPKGWRPTVRKGGTEEGYLGNGTWVHARDARYAAHDVLVLGCAPVTRDDYTDPTAALEGTLRSRDDQPGIGLVLEFATIAAARGYFDLYRRQVSACTDPQGSVYAEILDSKAGLIDRRTYPDGEWTEVAHLVGRRLTLVILSDPGHQIPVSAAESLRAQITAIGVAADR